MTKKFVLAPDSFKESMSAKEACLAMEKGILAVFKDADIQHVPMADGGEGTVDSLVVDGGGAWQDRFLIKSLKPITAYG